MGFAIFLSYRRESPKSGVLKTVTRQLWNFVQWSFCKRIIGKLSDLEVLIKKKQDCCLVGRVRRSFQSFTLTFHHRHQVV